MKLRDESRIILIDTHTKACDDFFPREYEALALFMSPYLADLFFKISTVIF